MLATAKYTALKDQTQFTFDFSYRGVDKIRVFVDGFERAQSTFTIGNGILTMQFPMAGGEKVVIKRETDIDVRQVDFTDAAILRESDLDNALIQVFQKLQELQDRVDELEGV